MSCSLPVYENRPKNQAIKPANSGTKLSAVLLCATDKHQTFFDGNFWLTSREQEKEHTSKSTNISWNATENTMNCRNSEQLYSLKWVQHLQYPAILPDPLDLLVYQNSKSED